MQELPQFQLRDPAARPASRDEALPGARPGSGYGVSEQPVSGLDLIRHLLRRLPRVEHRRLRRREHHLHLHYSASRGQLTIKQDTQPNDPQDFHYTIDGGLSPSSFTLDDDGDDSNGTSSTQTLLQRPGRRLSTSSSRRIPAWSRYIGTCSNGSPIDRIEIHGGREHHLHGAQHPGRHAATGIVAGRGRRDAGQQLERAPGAVSANGRYVVFESYATNLVARRFGHNARHLLARPANGRDEAGQPRHRARVARRRMTTRCGRRSRPMEGTSPSTPRRQPVSGRSGYSVLRRLRPRHGRRHHHSREPGTGAAGARGTSAHVQAPSISADGRFIAFVERDQLYDAGPDTNIDVTTSSSATCMRTRRPCRAGRRAKPAPISNDSSERSRRSPATGATWRSTPPHQPRRPPTWTATATSSSATSVQHDHRWRAVRPGRTARRDPTTRACPSMSGDGRYVAFFVGFGLDPGDAQDTGCLRSRSADRTRRRSRVPARPSWS